MGFFERGGEAHSETGYAAFDLAGNPFPATREGEPPSLEQLVSLAQARKAADMIVESVGAGEAKSFWVLRDESARHGPNVGVVSGLLQTLAATPSPRFFLAYAPLPVIYEKPLRGMLSMLVERLFEGPFRRCLYAFAYGQLKKAAEAGQEKLDDLDVRQLLGDMDETEGHVLDELLWPTPPTPPELPEPEEGAPDEGAETEKIAPESSAEEGQPAPDESAAEAAPTDDEAAPTDEEGEAGEPAGEAVAEAPAGHAALREFLLKRVDESDLGFQVKHALTTALNDHPETGRLALGANPARETLMGVFRFINGYYDRTVLFIDHLEGWGALEESERSKFLGAMTEFRRLGRGSSLLVLLGYKRAIEYIGEELAAVYKRLAVDLSALALPGEEGLDVEKTGKLITYFLDCDAQRTQTGAKGTTSPFEAEAIEEILLKCDKDPARVVSTCRDLLEAAVGKQVTKIDKQFVLANVT